MSKEKLQNEYQPKISNMKLKILSPFLILLCAIFACDPEPDLKDCSENPTENIKWLKELIEKENNTTDSNGLEIVQYNYKDQTVFLVEDCIKNCSDGLAIVYDCEQNVLCEFGGIAGLNTCPDFEDNATEKRFYFLQEKIILLMKDVKKKLLLIPRFLS